jgi:hypothetical protein
LQWGRFILKKIPIIGDSKMHPHIWVEAQQKFIQRNVKVIKIVDQNNRHNPGNQQNTAWTQQIDIDRIKSKSIEQTFSQTLSTCNRLLTFETVALPEV